MSDYRFELEKYHGLNSRHDCPQCEKKHHFSRYIDNNTGQYVHEEVGLCDNKAKCGYHKTPRQFFFENPDMKDASPFICKATNHQVKKSDGFSTISDNVLKESLSVYSTNKLIRFFHDTFNEETISRLRKNYFLGTSDHWEGATIFWYIDFYGRTRSGKIMLYNEFTGHRIKNPFNHITWVHKVKKYQEYNLKVCLYGEHLLKLYPESQVRIVESEKTALIASGFLPQYVWLAAGSLNSLSTERCLILKDKEVVLYPDLKCYSKWEKKAYELSHITKIRISSLLEEIATEEDRIKGLDLADFLIRFDTNNDKLL